MEQTTPPPDTSHAEMLSHSSLTPDPYTLAEIRNFARPHWKGGCWAASIICDRKPQCQGTHIKFNHIHKFAVFLCSNGQLPRERERESEAAREKSRKRKRTKKKMIKQLMTEPFHKLTHLFKTVRDGRSLGLRERVCQRQVGKQTRRDKEMQTEGLETCTCWCGLRWSQYSRKKTVEQCQTNCSQSCSWKSHTRRFHL